ncbi:MAG: DUF6092 family protein [Ornithinimicrobium sp.]|uniref:DUF6092 family protein n=1 Tax=Ornithinimicrobium sp. TaxID=1977084 RepID=UPI003D9B4980
MSEQVKVEEDLFDIVVYLVNSAPTSLGETPSLAAFRMMDAASRLLAVLQRTTSDTEQQTFLAEARADYDAHYNLVMTDQEAFKQWLPDFVRRCTEEAMRRAAAPSP